MKCLLCGKNIETTKRKNIRKFCSPACKTKYHSVKYILEKNKKRKNFECVVCGKKLTGRNYRYCSNACRLEAKRSTYNEECRKPQAENTTPEKEKPKYTLAQIEALARAEGLKYGEYVAKYGL